MDLKQHLLRQMAFSHATYGPGTRTNGVLDHIKKEVEEVRKSGGASDEWVDLVILSLDGLCRQLAYSSGAKNRRDPLAVVDEAASLIQFKQGKNEARTWPDWRTSDPNKAIEHDRTDEEEPVKHWSDWIEWDGKDLSGPDIAFQMNKFSGVQVNVATRGPDSNCDLFGKASSFAWGHTGGIDDIMRFRIEVMEQI